MLGALVGVRVVVDVGVRALQQAAGAPPAQVIEVEKIKGEPP